MHYNYELVWQKSRNKKGIKKESEGENGEVLGIHDCVPSDRDLLYIQDFKGRIFFSQSQSNKSSSNKM